MAIVTKATRGAVAGNGWTSAGNAVADDQVYATCAPAKNGTVTGVWDFAAFSDAEIPVGSTINSVTITAQYKVSTTSSVASVILHVINNGVEDNNSTQSTEPTTDTNFAVPFAINPSEADLKTAGAVTAQFDAKRGNSNTGVTFSLDFIQIAVDYTVSGPTFNDSGSGSIALGGSRTESASSADSRTGTLTLSGSGVESYHPPGITNNDSGLGTISLGGSGSGSQSRTGSGSGSLALSGSASESQTGSASRSGSLALGGSGTQSSTHTRSGAGTISLSGSGLELFQPPGDTGTGTITLSGSATPSFVHSSSGTGTINLSGTRLDSQAGSRTGNGTITLSGSGSQSSGDTTWVKSDHVPLGAVISHQGR